MELSYQQKVLLAAAEICRESEGGNSQREYKMYFVNGSLNLDPFAVLDGQKRQFADVLVGVDRILSCDETLIDELEKKVKEMFP